MSESLYDVLEPHNAFDSDFSKNSKVNAAATFENDAAPAPPNNSRTAELAEQPSHDKVVDDEALLDDSVLYASDAEFYVIDDIPSEDEDDLLRTPTCESSSPPPSPPQEEKGRLENAAKQKMELPAKSMPAEPPAEEGDSNAVSRQMSRGGVIGHLGPRPTSSDAAAAGDCNTDVRFTKQLLLVSCNDVSSSTDIPPRRSAKERLGKLVLTSEAADHQEDELLWNADDSLLLAGGGSSCPAIAESFSDVQAGAVLQRRSVLDRLGEKVHFPELQSDVPDDDDHAVPTTCPSEQPGVSLFPENGVAEVCRDEIPLLPNGDPDGLEESLDDEWWPWRQLTTDDERFSATRQRWGYQINPDPTRDLTHPNYEQRNFGPLLLQAQGRQRGQKRALTEPEPSDRSCKRLRRASCQELYSRELNKLQKELEAQNSCQQEVLADNHQELDNMYAKERAEVIKRCLSMQDCSQYEKMTNQLDFRYNCRKAQLQNLYSNDMQNIANAFEMQRDKLLRSREEIVAFQKFYISSNNNNNNNFYNGNELEPPGLDESQLTQIKEAEKMYSLFQRFYPQEF